MMKVTALITFLFDACREGKDAFDRWHTRKFQPFRAWVNTLPRPLRLTVEYILIWVAVLTALLVLAFVGQFISSGVSAWILWLVLGIALLIILGPLLLYAAGKAAISWRARRDAPPQQNPPPRREPATDHGHDHNAGHPEPAPRPAPRYRRGNGWFGNLVGLAIVIVVGLIALRFWPSYGPPAIEWATGNGGTLTAEPAARKASDQKWSNYLSVPHGKTLWMCDKKSNPNCLLLPPERLTFVAQCVDLTSGQPINWTPEACQFSNKLRIHSRDKQKRRIRFEFKNPTA